MDDPFALLVLYRMVYGRARERVAGSAFREPPEAVVAEPLLGVGPLEPTSAENPEAAAVIRDAVDDALAGRKPRW